ncbi:MAG: PHP domain-containing protein [Dehalococcoidales bacterium]|nr:PHP domain-containing protein [Dehalococcoidales bacterium]
MSKVDLHVHSTASDGRYSPREIIRMAVARGLEYLALTDHDSVDGIEEATRTAEEYPGLTFIPGVEISTDVADGEIHMLGYFIDHTDRRLREALEEFRTSRENRAQGMVKKLAGLGMPLEWERVQELAGDGSIGRPHIARAMLEKGYISSFEEAFEKYIGRGCPAYVERKKMTPQEAVRLVLDGGGLPVLAHPFTVANPEGWLKELKPAGLIGVEAYYRDNTPEATSATLSLAERYGLIVTGGSDYHGIGESHEVGLGGVMVPVTAAEGLIRLARERGIPRASQRP